jgi:hypothetical protein
VCVCVCVRARVCVCACVCVCLMNAHCEAVFLNAMRGSMTENKGGTRRHMLELVNGFDLDAACSGVMWWCKWCRWETHHQQLVSERRVCRFLPRLELSPHQSAQG